MSPCQAIYFVAKIYCRWQNIKRATVDMRIEVLENLKRVFIQFIDHFGVRSIYYCQRIWYLTVLHLTSFTRFLLLFGTWDFHLVRDSSVLDKTFAFMNTSLNVLNVNHLCAPSRRWIRMNFISRVVKKIIWIGTTNYDG